MTTIAVPDLLPAVADFVSRDRRMLIGGQWVDALSGRTFDTHDPATGQVITRVAHGEAPDVDRAVAAARAAYEGPWSRMKPNERERLIWKVGDILSERAEIFGQLEALDNGKSVAIATGVDVGWSADVWRYNAGLVTKIRGAAVTPSMPFAPDGQFHAYTRRESLGVCGQIVPWNFPILMATWKLAPALAAGNTVVLKPAEQTPLTALLLGEVFEEAGFPPGVVNIVPGFGDAGAALSGHPDVDKVAFTGSTEVGKKIVSAATGNLKKVSLELGGKSPNIVFADADLEAAVAGSVAAWTFNHGQCCVAGTRMFVQRSIFDEFTQAVADAAAALADLPRAPQLVGGQVRQVRPVALASSARWRGLPSDGVIQPTPAFDNSASYVGILVGEPGDLEGFLQTLRASGLGAEATPAPSALNAAITSPVLGVTATLTGLTLISVTAFWVLTMRSTERAALRVLRLLGVPPLRAAVSRARVSLVPFLGAAGISAALWQGMVLTGAVTEPSPLVASGVILVVLLGDAVLVAATHVVSLWMRAPR